MSDYQPKTGQPCSCRKGIQRDNCPKCEGTGWIINFAAIRARNTAKQIEVIVSNIGTVYAGQDEVSAKAKYDLYVEASQHEEGTRAHGESVTMLVDGEIEFQFAGEIEVNGER